VGALGWGPQRRGDVLWRQALSAPPYGATTVVNDLVFATTFEGELLAFDTATGHEAWRETLPDGTNAGVMASGSMLIAPAGIPTKQGDTPQLVAFRLPGRRLAAKAAAPRAGR